ncbi:MAG: sigma-70 family RNA polymerase sigma factor [Acidobacteriota bacterium]
MTGESLEPRSDEDLAALAQRGSAEAFRLLVVRYQRPVLALIGRLVREPALAEDLAQEAFVRAHERLDSFDTSRRFSSWLFKIAHNRTVDHLRRKRPETVDLEARGADGGTFEVLAAPPGEGPLRRAESAQLGALMEQAIAALRPNYREVLLLRFQAGLSYSEIAETLGITLATVKVQLHRARKRLIVELEARGVTPPPEP